MVLSIKQTDKKACYFYFKFQLFFNVAVMTTALIWAQMACPLYRGFEKSDYKNYQDSID